jgi:osomolarity two-component system, response regulator SKN7
MDDVLPKPFTRKSLLDMLEKHLSHLKKLPPGMEPPPSASASSVPHSSTGQSTKDDVSSPSQSPAGSMANWQSPNQYPGVSPIHTNIANQYATMASQSPYSTSPQTPLTGSRPGHHQPSSHQQQQQQQQQQHRRQLSEMSGGAPDMNGYNKRQRLYGQPGQTMGMPGAPQ